MKPSQLVLALILPLLTSSAVAQSSRPIPPGVRHADQADAQMGRDLPPPLESHPNVDAAKVKHDADELAALAQSIPSAVDQSTKGVLPKDLGEKLKRIERLAKHLRGEPATQ